MLKSAVRSPIPLYQLTLLKGYVCPWRIPLGPLWRWRRRPGRAHRWRRGRRALGDRRITRLVERF